MAEGLKAPAQDRLQLHEETRHWFTQQGKAAGGPRRQVRSLVGMALAVLKRLGMVGSEF